MGVAGIWVLVVAVAKFGMAVAALGGAGVFATLADQDYENICFAIYLFRWSLLLALPFQCIAGVAIWHIQANAARYIGCEARANGWVTLFVSGNFCAGVGVWWAGYLDCVHEAGLLVAFCFIAAALGQLLAGVSLVLINRK